MKTFQKVLLLFTLFLIGACHSDEPTKSISTLFTVVVEPSISTADSDNWVMVSDTDGNWLDAKPYESGDSIVLTGDIPDNKTVTLHFLVQAKPNASSYIDIQSYTNLTASDKWRLKRINNLATNFGSASVLLNNIQYDPASPVVVSSASGRMTGSSTGTYNTFLFNDLFMAENPSNLMFSFFKNGLPYNVMVNEVTPGANMTVDVSNIEKPMDVMFDFDYSGDSFFDASFFCQVAGKPAALYDGYTMSNYTSYDGATGSVTLGYQNGFDGYATKIEHIKNGVTYEYAKIGAPLKQVPVFPELNLSVQSTVAPQIGVTPGLVYDMAELMLTPQSTQDFAWRVLLPKPDGTSKLTFPFKTLPPQMTALFPIPDLAQIKLSYVSVWQFLDGFTYSNYIQQRRTSGAIASAEYFAISTPL